MLYAGCSEAEIPFLAGDKNLAVLVQSIISKMAIFVA